MDSAANAGSARDPQLRVFMNLMALDSLPRNSVGPRGSFQQKMEALKDAGFDGVQFANIANREQLDRCASLGLGFAGSGRINTPEEASLFAEKMAGDGYACATLHVGWGLEDDGQAARLIESVLDAVERWRVPLYIETHRATIFQDIWRTVSFVRRFREIRINGDFSHWYTGQEMVYGGFEKKLAFIEPVLERVRFIHGRIGNPGCMQVPVVADAVYVEHFKQLWTASFRRFLESAQAGDSITFAPELLAPDIYYARTFPAADGDSVEESDRWEQSLLLKQMAEDCFRNAKC
ncbi:MAG TPA: hypothetical protein VLI55_13855 [Bryobacteraceae bacterium]|nr:hypothetical protein [Bryobacteraceae bacterium]